MFFSLASLVLCQTLAAVVVRLTNGALNTTPLFSSYLSLLWCYSTVSSNLLQFYVIWIVIYVFVLLDIPLYWFVDHTSIFFLLLSMVLFIAFSCFLLCYVAYVVFFIHLLSFISCKIGLCILFFPQTVKSQCMIHPVDSSSYFES